VADRGSVPPVAIVTGSGGSLGRAAALRLGADGFAVAAFGRAGDPLSETVRQLDAAGVRHLEVSCDLRDPRRIDESVRRVDDELGPVDVLVNNSGACFHRPALEVPDEEWRAVFDVNVDGLWRCSRTVGRQMVERGTGAIINVGSISAQIVNRPQWQPAYNASKAAVHQLTKSLAAEWAPHGVRVNALAPGYVKTEMAPVDDPKFKPRWIDDAAMQRYALPEELGPSIVYLASDASSFMTGSVLVIDGGYTLF
jgi:NAD(P)-dependent dehydrogenase (short-subunit alcohol dehydrogenase family)